MTTHRFFLNYSKSCCNCYVRYVRCDIYFI